jgi:adenine-specific DNA methylase
VLLQILGKEQHYQLGKIKKMKDIQPITIWNKGTANKFSLKLISDNLIDSAIFVYELISYNENADVMNGENKYETLVSGNIEIIESDYSNWSGGNSEAYQLCSNKLSITIIN